MITKWYEVTCDWCGGAINHYIDKKPSKKMLKDEGCILHKDKIFCTEQCYNNYKLKKIE